MSLLRDLLKRGGPGLKGDPKPLSAKKNVKSYAASVKSSGGASMRSIAGSIFSFYSAVTGSGPKVAKRRRPDYSILGAPSQWYASDPPAPQEIPGTAPPSIGDFPPFTMAHSVVMHATSENPEPWLGVVLYSHALPTSPLPMYHNGAEIKGQVRMVLDKPTALSSVSVWFTVTSDSVTEMLKPPVLNMTATLWSRKYGDPRTTGGEPFKGKFPAGTYVFPFEFPALPADTVIKHPDDERHKNLARVPLPPTYTFAEVGSFSGNIKYTVGVNVAREGLGAIDEEFDVSVQYLPLSRVVPREESTFPYLPLREDWPFAREVVGGWTLTPFGGRGRIGEELVELEGILGIQEPAVYTAGQTLPFSLLLWSPSALAMQALAQPGAIDVGFFKSDIFSRDALYPRNTVRKNRKLERLADGQIWLTDEGRPEEGAGKPECKLVDLPEPSGKAPAASPVKATPSPARPSRMQTVWGPDVDDDEATTVGDDEENGKDKADARAPSPTPSLEDLDSEPDGERTVRLDGEVRVPACSHPSFRFSSMAREYVLHILIQHPQYSHISPTATGIIGEVPVWYVLDRFANRSEGNAESRSTDYYSKLPIRGAEIPVGEGAVRLPLRTASATTQKRPTYRLQRVAAF